MLVLSSQLIDNFLISFKPSTGMFHGIENKHTLRNMTVLVCCEPVGEDSIWGTWITLGKFFYFDSWRLKGEFKVVKFSLGLLKKQLELINFWLNLVSNKTVKLIKSDRVVIIYYSRKISTYDLIGAIIFHFSCLFHELIVNLAVFVPVEDLRPDHNDLIREDRPRTLPH